MGTAGRHTEAPAIWITLLLCPVLATAALFLAFLIRFDFQLTFPSGGAPRNWYWLYFAPALIPVVLIKTFALLLAQPLFRVSNQPHARIWLDLLITAAASWVATIIFFLFVYATGLLFGALHTPMPPFFPPRLPRSIYAIDLALFTVMVCVVRLIVLLRAARRPALDSA